MEILWSSTLPLAESFIDVILHCDVSKIIAEGELQNMSPIRGLLRSNIRVSWRSTTHGEKNCSLLYLFKKLFMEQKCSLDREKIAKWLLFLLEVSKLARPLCYNAYFCNGLSADC